MGFLDRIFGRKRAGSAATAEDQARSQALSGRATTQSDDDQTATRARMEAELAAQRQQRGQQPSVPDA
ncbi:MAG: hypothetical protein ACRDJ9_22770 [Dehalococcoidia bacterium]